MSLVPRLTHCFRMFTHLDPLALPPAGSHRLNIPHTGLGTLLWCSSWRLHMFFPYPVSRRSGSHNTTHPLTQEKHAHISSVIFFIKCYRVTWAVWSVKPLLLGTNFNRAMATDTHIIVILFFSHSSVLSCLLDSKAPQGRCWPHLSSITPTSVYNTITSAEGLPQGIRLAQCICVYAEEHFHRQAAHQHS